MARPSDGTLELRHRRGRAVRERLDDVVLFDELGSREIRDRPRDLERAIEPATGERVEVDRRREELARVRRDPRLAPRYGTGELRVARETEGRVTPTLARSGQLDAFANRGRALPRLFAEQLSLGEPRDHQPDVDTVEQRPREFGLIGLQSVVSTRASPDRVA